jgi:hypothetical protein
VQPLVVESVEGNARNQRICNVDTNHVWQGMPTILNS